MQRLQGKPFALLGVNNDDDREHLKKRVIPKEGISWRSWWDPENQIAKPWGVQKWPTIYLIDHKGVIRFEDLHGRPLDEAIDRLVQEAESDKAK